MLQNAYFLAKIGADTAENERNSAENLPKICNYPTGPLPRRHDVAEPAPDPRRAERAAQGHGREQSGTYDQRG